MAGRHVFDLLSSFNKKKGNAVINDAAPPKVKQKEDSHDRQPLWLETLCTEKPWLLKFLRMHDTSETILYLLEN